MNEAAKILFETNFEGVPLFISQLDLATSLLNDSDSAYYVHRDELDKYSKALTRLKTYVSQLLSSTVARSVTEDFASGLLIVVSKKLTDQAKARDLVDKIISDLKRQNSGGPKSEPKLPINQQFIHDLAGANYIAVITSKPLEIGLPHQEDYPPLRKYLFEDLLQSLYDPNKNVKYYRFNFPISSFGHLFWRGLKKILLIRFQVNLSDQLLESLYQKFEIRSNISLDEFRVEKNSNKIEELVDQTLSALNLSRHILVFVTEAPIYSLPIVAIEPSDNKKIKIYSLIDSDSQGIAYYKLPERENILWRMFVWDQLKSPKYAGVEIKYSIEGKV